VDAELGRGATHATRPDWRRAAGRAYTRAVDPLAHHLLTQALNNAWANHRLLVACAQLGQAEFEAARTGFFPSIKATLNHNLTVDWYYIDAMERSLAGRPVNENFMAFYEPEQPCSTSAGLQAEQSAIDRRLIALCERLSADDLLRDVAVPRRAGTVMEPLVRLLAHLFQHQIHHRGQAHAMLSGSSVEPPQLDEFFCAGDAPLRAAEFETLGFSESSVWQPTRQPTRQPTPRPTE
jgi:uncharacterized damage-inducible protein DinB